MRSGAIKRGDLISLGCHKLLCGDATNREDIMRLVGDSKVDLIFQDPPYGVNVQHRSDAYIGGGGGPTAMFCKKKRVMHYERCVGDLSPDTARKNYEALKDLTPNKIIWGGNYFTDFLPPSGGWLFWDKERPSALDFGDGELAYCSLIKTVKKYLWKWNGCVMKGSALLNPRPRVHPMQKPVELHMKILEDFSKEGAVVLDCFGGSGTTLIACELTHRTCLMMEISPEYCEIIRERYEKVSEKYLLFKGEC